MTSYTAGLGGVIAEFDISMTHAIFGFSVYLLGIAFAPIHAPHISERYGRSIFYLCTFFIFMLFVLGASRSTTITGLLVCRFFAGFFGVSTCIHLNNGRTWLI
jgi:DHA1 family multidrug resistance protein-like MFS transporter